MTNILVVGGAGYIGSHTCLDLSDKGYTPVVFDNLANGHLEFVRWGPFERGDIRDRARIDEVFRRYRPVAVIHFAGLIEVGESIKDPMRFFENNVAGSLTLLSATLDAGIDKFVFSSTCATYGIPTEIPLREEHDQLPINPYGRSKLLVEQVLRDLDSYKALRSVVLRYFNAAGADPEGRIGEWHTPETHAVPLAIDVALGRRPVFKIFGSDYDTRDGTCVRDFVHVMDLANAHTRAIEYLLDGGGSTSLNLGTGDGTTVKELLSTIESVSGRRLPTEYAARREGDSPKLVADNTKAMEILQWKPHHNMTSIIKSAWNWHSRTNTTAATEYAALRSIDHSFASE
jgi:UDP-glucose 4-epimerase